MREHPDKQPVRVRPDFAGVWNPVLEVTPRVERRKPMAPGHVYEQRVYLAANLVEQPIGQQTVLAAARKHCNLIL